MAEGGRSRGRRAGARGWLAAAAVVAIAAAAGTWYFGLWGGGKPEAGNGQEPPPVPVAVAEVRRGEARDSVSTVGEVVARSRITVTSEVAGRVVDIPVADGSEVRAGDTLLRLDAARELAALEAAEARADEARLQFERTQELLERNVAAEAALDEQEATLRTAEAEVSRARTALEQKTVRAPFDGRLGFILVDLGAVLEPGDAIAELSSLPPVRLRFRLPERFLAGLDLGDAVIGTTAAFPDAEFMGRVATIDPTVDSDTRNVMAEAELADPQGRLRPGLFLDATVVLRTRQDALLVPEVALQVEGPVSYVYRVDEERRARRAQVAIGARARGQVEITDGLEAGDRVIVEGVQKVADGRPVEPQAAETAAAPGGPS